MGEGNKFLSLRGSMLDAQGEVRKDIFKPRGDIHLNTAGTQIASLRIQQMLTIMLPNLVPVQTPPAPVPAIVQAPAVAKPQRTRVQAPVSDPAPVVVDGPPAVDATLVAAVVNAPVVVNQDQVESPMEVEDEDSILERLFFKKYGRALPEKEKEKDNEVDKINFVIDLTDETDEMEVATSDVVPVAVVKTEPIEIANVTNAAKVVADRKERRELVKARKALIVFGKTLRKSVKIPEKEVPEVSADSNVSADTSVNPVNSVNTIEMAERAIAETDAAIAANQKEFTAEFGDTPLDEFDDESEFRLYRSEEDVIEDDDDAMIDNV
jgi:hypothetical protein